MRDGSGWQTTRNNFTERFVHCLKNVCDMGGGRERESKRWGGSRPTKEHGWTCYNDAKKLPGRYAKIFLKFFFSF